MIDEYLDQNAALISLFEVHFPSIGGADLIP